MQPTKPGSDQVNGTSGERSGSKRFFLPFCCLVALAKLVLISTDEIISTKGDAAVYASQIMGPWTLGYMQGYPLWLRLCHLFEVPQRLAIEGLYLLSAVAMGFAVRKVFDARTGYLTVGLLALAPYTYFLFDLGLPDGFYLCLTLLALSVSTHLLVARTRGELLVLSLGLGALLGFMAITRNEDPLLALWVLLIVGAIAYKLHREPRAVFNWQFWRRPVISGLLTAAAACAVVFCLCFSFYVTDDVFARDAALIPGHFKLLKDLAQIDTGQPQLRFVPISKRSRELAYSASPTLAKLRSSVEDPADNWQVMSRESGLPPGEIGGNLIWQTFNSKLVFQSDGERPTADERPAAAEAKYEKMDAELAAAFRDGRLKKRFTINPLIGGDLPALIGDLPHSASAVMAAAMSDQAEDPPDQNFNAGLFNRAFLRRAALIKIPEVTVEGWAFFNSPDQKVSRVVVGSDLIASAPVVNQDRPDVVSSVAKQSGWKPDVFGFHAIVKSSSPNEVTVTYYLSNGSQVEAQHLKVHEVSALHVKEMPGRDVLQGIDTASSLTGNDAPEWQHGVQLSIVRLFGALSSPLLTVAIVLLAFGFSGYTLLLKQDGRWKITFVFFSLGIALWISRIFFYSVLNARAWDGARIRYLAPTHALELVLLSVAIAALTRMSVKRSEIEHRKPSDPRFLN